MENTQYLKVLKSQLRTMDATSRQNILNEVKSSIEDDPSTSLEARFGSPYQLAATYLEDMPVRATWWQRIGKGVKWLMIGLGVLLLVIIIALYSFFKFFANDADDFDYSDVNNAELAQMNWEILDGLPSSIDVIQSRLVVYSGDYQEISYFCAREEKDEDDEYSFVYVEGSDVLKISHNKCYLRVPASLKFINATQADIVLTDLANDLEISLWQAQMRLALGEPVSVENNTNQCEFAAENNLDGGAATLTLNGSWCAVSDYVFED